MRKLFPILIFILLIPNIQGAIYLFTDSFNRSNSGTVGNGWNETESDTLFFINSNQLVSTALTAGGGNQLYHLINTSPSDYVTYKTRINMTSYTSGNVHFYLMNGTTPIANIKFSGNDISVTNGGADVSLQGFNISTSYIIYLETRQSDDKITRANINGIMYNGTWNFENPSTTTNGFNTFFSSSAVANYTMDYIEIWNDTIENQPPIQNISINFTMYNVTITPSIVFNDTGVVGYCLAGNTTYPSIVYQTRWYINQTLVQRNLSEGLSLSNFVNNVTIPSLNSPGWGAINGGRLYIPAGNTTLLYNISAENRVPILIGNYTGIGIINGARQVCTSSQDIIIIIANLNDSIAIVNYTNSTSPSLIFSYFNQSSINDPNKMFCDWNNNVVYVADNSDHFSVYNISQGLNTNKTNFLISVFSNSSFCNTIVDMDVQGNITYGICSVNSAFVRLERLANYSYFQKSIYNSSTGLRNPRSFAIINSSIVHITDLNSSNITALNYLTGVQLWSTNFSVGMLNPEPIYFNNLTKIVTFSAVGSDKLLMYNFSDSGATLISSISSSSFWDGVNRWTVNGTTIYGSSNIDLGITTAYLGTNQSISTISTTLNPRYNTGSNLTLECIATDFVSYSNAVNFTTIIVFNDTVIPNVSSSFVNGSLQFGLVNLTAQFNFTDETSLFSYNISIDQVQILGANGLNGTFIQVNLSQNISNLSAQKHILNIRVADGHTANEIEEYKVSDGLWNNKLKFEWGYNKEVVMTNKDSSIFDKFSTQKEKDRYTWDFKPSKESDTYTFEIEAKDKIFIMENENTEFKKWLVFDNKWMDFYMPDEEANVDIERISDTKVEVTLSNIKNPKEQIYHSIGDINIVYLNYTFYKINATVSYSDPTFEGATNVFRLRLDMANLSTFIPNSTFIWSNYNFGQGSLNFSTNDTATFTNSFTSFYNGSTTPSWVYYFNVSGNSTTYSINGTQSLTTVNITNCSSGYVVLNYTAYDEDNRTILNASTTHINIDIILTSQTNTSLFWNFSTQQTNNNVLICLPINILNSSSYTLGATAEYYSTGYVLEHNLIDNFNLTMNNIPKTIALYDLLTTRSTSFLITYQDENYLFIEDAIIEVIRQYIGQNAYFAVESERTDQSGETVVHLVGEDIYYYFNIYRNGVLDFTTGSQLALCQVSPCSISIIKSRNESGTTPNYQNIVYSLTPQSEFQTTRTIVFTFNSVDGTPNTFNFTLLTLNQTQAVCSQVVTSTSSIVSCPVTLGFGNSSYFLKISKNGQPFGFATYSLSPTAKDTFGNTGIFLGSLGYILLILSAAFNPIIMIVMAIIGGVFMSGLILFEGASLFSFGAAGVWLLVAGCILIWKINSRRTV